MLQVIFLSLSTIRCGLYTNLPSLDGISRNDLNRQQFCYPDIVDILSKDCSNNNNVLRTIFKYIPATGCEDVCLRNNVVPFNLTDSNIGTSFASIYLQTAIKFLAEPDSKIDDLAAETILGFFYSWLLSSLPTRAGPRPDFKLPKFDNLTKSAGSAIIELASSRATRNIFSIFLRALLNELGDSQVHSFKDCESKKLNEIYREYLRAVLRKLLEQIDFDRRYFGDNKADQFESFYVFIPSTNVANKLASIILQVDAWVNQAATKE